MYYTTTCKLKVKFRFISSVSAAAHYTLYVIIVMPSFNQL